MPMLTKGCHLLQTRDDYQEEWYDPWNYYGYQQGMQGWVPNQYMPPSFQQRPPLHVHQPPPPPPPPRGVPAALGAPPPSVSVSVEKIPFPQNSPQQQESVRSQPTEVPDDSLSSDTTEEGEIQTDSDGDIFAEMSDTTSSSEHEEDRQSVYYTEQVRKVMKLRKLPINEESEEEVFTLSGAPQSQRKKRKVAMPAPDCFSKYMKFHCVEELKDEKGGKPLPVGQLPKLYKPRMTCYEVKNGWAVDHLKEDTGLCKSSLYRGSDAPTVKMNQSTLKKLETHNRQAVNVGCYTDAFLWSASKMMKQVRKKLKAKQYEKKPVLNVSGIKDIYRHTEEAIMFMQSAARGLQDLSRMTMDEVGCLVTLRRDNWIDAMTRDLPNEQKFALRQLDMSGNTLFGQEALERASRAVERARQDDTNLEMKRAIKEDSRKDRNQKSNFRGERDDSKGKKYQEKVPYHSFSNRRQKKEGGRGGGNSNRGNRGGPKR